MELTITKERVLEVVKYYPDSTEWMKTLFPEVFKDGDKYIEIKPFKLDKFFNEEDGVIVAIGDGLAPSCTLKGRCLILSKLYNWEFTEKFGYTVAIPTKKK